MGRERRVINMVDRNPVSSLSRAEKQKQLAKKPGKNVVKLPTNEQSRHKKETRNGSEQPIALIRGKSGPGGKKVDKEKPSPIPGLPRDDDSLMKPRIRSTRSARLSPPISEISEDPGSDDDNQTGSDKGNGGGQ
jgi:hypothetical protein